MTLACRQGKAFLGFSHPRQPFFFSVQLPEWSEPLK